MTPRKLAIPVAITAMMTLGFLCHSDPSEPDMDEPGDGVNKADEARIKVLEANNALEDVLFDLLNADIDEPADIDFELPNLLYRLALDLDPDNLDANFGAGLTELLIITNDQQIQDAFDEWEAFLDTALIFEVELPMGGMAKASLD